MARGSTAKRQSRRRTIQSRLACLLISLIVYRANKERRTTIAKATPAFCALFSLNFSSFRLAVFAICFARSAKFVSRVLLADATNSRFLFESLPPQSNNSRAYKARNSAKRNNFATKDLRCNSSIDCFFSASKLKPRPKSEKKQLASLFCAPLFQEGAQKQTKRKSMQKPILACACFAPRKVSCNISLSYLNIRTSINHFAANRLCKRAPTKCKIEQKQNKAKTVRETKKAPNS